MMMCPFIECQKMKTGQCNADLNTHETCVGVFYFSKLWGSTIHTKHDTGESQLIGKTMTPTTLVARAVLSLNLVFNGV